MACFQLSDYGELLLHTPGHNVQNNNIRVKKEPFTGDSGHFAAKIRRCTCQKREDISQPYLILT